MTPIVIPISAQAFGIVYAVASAVLALWVDDRWPDLTPQSLQAVVTRSLIALALTTAADSLIGLAATGLAVQRIAALVLILLPTTTYMFVTCIWVMKHLQGQIRAHRP